MTASDPTAPPVVKIRIARHSVFNLLGLGIPLLVAFLAIPRLIQGLGTDRFGVLTLAWIVIGYFSLFDLGFGRALTQLVAEKLSEGYQTKAPPLVWTALTMILLVGLVGLVLVSAASPWMVHSVLRIPVELQVETLHSFYVLAAGIPAVVVTAGLAGILTAYQRFGVLNAIRAPMGIYTFAAPLLVLPFSQSLLLVTTVLVVGRLLACGAHFLACRRYMPPLHWAKLLEYGVVKPLFGFGTWITVTNVVAPLMRYLDRFIIGATLSIAAVAYYATPYEMVTRLLIVPGAILGVLFPAFAASYRQNHEHLVRLFTRGTKYIALLLFPAVLVIAAFAGEGLRWWLGEEFALHSTPVLQCLAIGVFINSLSQVPFTLIQGVGRPDLTAKLHLMEFPIYLPVLWWAITAHGIVGAALVWTGRVGMDGILLFWLSSHFLIDRAKLLKRMTGAFLVGLSALVIPLLIPDPAVRGAVVALILAGFASTAWFVLLAADERASIKGRLGWAYGQS